MKTKKPKSKGVYQNHLKKMKQKVEQETGREEVNALFAVWVLLLGLSGFFIVLIYYSLWMK